MNKIIIFGSGEAGKWAVEYYRRDNNTDILCIADNNSKKHGSTLNGIPIIPPDAITQQPYDQIIIASMYHQEIIRQLTQELSISVEKIGIISTNIQKGNIDFSDTKRAKLAREMLLAVCKQLNDAKIAYHIDHGTLLGIYRDGDILPWDNDIDLAIHFRDTNAVMATLEHFAQVFKSSLCKNNAWQYKPLIGELIFDNKTDNKIRIIRFENTAECAASNKLGLDFIVKHPHNGQLHWLAGGLTILAADERYFKECTFIEYYGTPLSIPAETDVYLTCLFDDWRTPCHHWNHARYANIVNALDL